MSPEHRFEHRAVGILIHKAYAHLHCLIPLDAFFLHLFQFILGRRDLIILFYDLCLNLLKCQMNLLQPRIELVQLRADRTLLFFRCVQLFLCFFCLVLQPIDRVTCLSQLLLRCLFRKHRQYPTAHQCSGQYTYQYAFMYDSSHDRLPKIKLLISIITYSGRRGIVFLAVLCYTVFTLF